MTQLNETQFRKAWEVSEDFCTIYEWIVDAVDASCTPCKTLVTYFRYLNKECKAKLLKYLHEQDRTKYLYALIDAIYNAN